jgi:hypothetical protein
MFYLIPRKEYFPRGEKGNASWQSEPTILSQYANDIGFTIWEKKKKLLT